MKTIIKFLAVLLVLNFTFTSCDEIEELADVSIESNIVETIDVQLVENQEYISKSIVLNIDNAGTHDYLDKLKSISIKSLTYKFIDFSGNENCYINVEISTDNNILESKEFYVKQANDDGTIYEITDVAKLNTMSAALLSNNQATFKVEGECFGTPADFKIEVTIELDIVANPL